MNIVIAGRFSPPVLACMRSWGRNGHRVGFIHFDDGGSRWIASKYLNQYTSVPLRMMGKTDGITGIKDFLETFDADILSCVDDNMMCWLDDHKSVFEPDVSLALPPLDMVKQILSKTYQNQIASDVGFQVLPEFIISPENKSSISIPSTYFPICLRPSEAHDVTPFFKVKLIESSKMLKRFLQGIQINNSGAIIAQPFKNLPNLVVHGIRTTAGDTKRLSGFIVERKFEGVTLTLKPYKQIDTHLINKCAQFVQSAELTGNFHFEFLLDPTSGAAFFLEINHRFGGTTAKALACGYDEPLYALEAHGIVKSCTVSPLVHTTVSNKQALLKYIIKAITGKLTLLDHPTAHPFRQCMAGLNGLLFHADEVIAFDDLTGSISLYANNFLNAVKGT